MGLSTHSGMTRGWENKEGELELTLPYSGRGLPEGRKYVLFPSVPPVSRTVLGRVEVGEFPLDPYHVGNGRSKDKQDGKDANCGAMCP